MNKPRPHEYIYRWKIPGCLSSACSCGWIEQIPKRVVLFYPLLEADKGNTLAEAKLSDYINILSTATALRVVTKWLLRLGILGSLKIT
jgi:hypothetical protein